MTASRETSPDIDVYFDTNSLGLDRLFTQAGVLTMFFKNNSIATYLIDEGRYISSGCFIYMAGMRDEKHASWHKSLSEYGLLHKHIIKLSNNASPIPITMQDIECFVRVVKSEEKHLSLCNDGITQCVISDDDAHRLDPSYWRIPNNKEPRSLETLAEDARKRRAYDDEALNLQL